MPNLDTPILELIASHDSDAYRDMQTIAREIAELEAEYSRRADTVLSRLGNVNIAGHYVSTFDVGSSQLENYDLRLEDNKHRGDLTALYSRGDFAIYRSESGDMLISGLEPYEFKNVFMGTYKDLNVCAAPHCLYGYDNYRQNPGAILLRYDCVPDVPDEVVIPEKIVLLDKREIPVVGVGDYAFLGCHMRSVTLPGSIRDIGVDAFAMCDRLQDVICEGQIYRRMLDVSNRKMYGLASEESDNVYIFTPGLYAQCQANNGFGYKDKGGKRILTAYWGHETNIVIPDGVTKIDRAFSDNSDVRTVHIPSTVTEIGNYTFYYCSNLTRMDVPCNVETIGRCAFAGCRNMTEVTLGDGVKSIGERAFSTCDKLERVIIPDSVENIKADAFGFSRVKTIVCSGEMADRLRSGDFGLGKHVEYITPEEYAAKEKKNNDPSLGD